MKDRNDKIERFLERVEKQVYTENAAKDIKAELMDHIECLLEDYEEAGFNEEIAISKALLQMGDPDEIGYAFTDYEGMKRRKFWINFLKFSSLVMILITFLPSFVSLNHNGMSLDFRESASLLPNLFNVCFLFYSSSLLMGHSMKFLDLDTTPFAILWPVKERVKWEYFAIFFFFVPVILIMFFVYFYEEGINQHSLLAMWPLLTLSYGVWAMFYKEKFRIPKVVLVNEGFIIKGRFISWAGIYSYNWTKDFLAKDQKNYKLILNLFQSSNGTYGLRKTISVNQRQYGYINEFLTVKIN
ncbi:MAG: hypothetical protein JXR88_18260 [Clostridia bacterium]|nr:hypothetical protein [Clostridia bacterium]